jgi:hypothetical protein
MKSVIGKLGYVFIFLFITGIFVTGFYLFGLPDLLHEKTIDYVTIEVKLVVAFIDTLNYYFLGTAFLGLAAIAFLLVGARNGNQENIVYVETFKAREEEILEGKGHVNLHSKYSEKIEELKKIIDQDNNEKLILNRVISKICIGLEASQGAIFRAVFEEDKRFIELWATFAYSVPDSLKVRYEFGEGLAGQAAKTGNMLNLKNVPEGYIKVLSGLGSSSPSHLIIIPLIEESESLGVIEIASFVEFASEEEEFLKTVASLLAKRLVISQSEAIPEAKD